MYFVEWAGIWRVDLRWEEEEDKPIERKKNEKVVPTREIMSRT